MENCGGSSETYKWNFSYDPAVPLLGTYPKKPNLNSYKQPYVWQRRLPQPR